MEELLSFGEVLACEREPVNAADRYAVAVKKEGTTVGHLHLKLSRVCSLFLRRGGTIDCTVTGRREYSADLAQGGLEIPCSLVFKATPREILKLKKVWKNNGLSHLHKWQQGNVINTVKYFL